MEKKVTPTEARQGRKGVHVLVVLVVALILAALAWWAAGIYGNAIEPENPVGSPASEQPAETPQSGTATENPD